MPETLSIVVAAGTGSRLLPATSNLPKCMLPVQNKPVLHHALDTFLDVGFTDTAVIGGYEKEALHLYEGTQLIVNDQYRNNNVLHSLAYARGAMDRFDTVLVTYSDILFRRCVVEKLMESDQEDITVIVDQLWADRYEGREQHPMSQAEAAQFSENHKLRRIGKDLLTPHLDAQEWGEFIGMFKLNHAGIELFWSVFDEVNATVSPDESFQQAESWRNAYITDLLQELVDRGNQVHCALIQGGWLEIDTLEDYQRAASFKFSGGCG